jgi:hydrogenase expression/formation protein HypC
LLFVTWPVKEVRMCLGIPGKVLQVDGVTARVDFGGVTRDVAIDLLPEVVPGQYVIVHAGYALQVLDEAEAAVTLALLDELARAQA